MPSRSVACAMLLPDWRTPSARNDVSDQPRNTSPPSEMLLTTQKSASPHQKPSDIPPGRDEPVLSLPSQTPFILLPVISSPPHPVTPSRLLALPQPIHQPFRRTIADRPHREGRIDAGAGGEGRSAQDVQAERVVDAQLRIDHGGGWVVAHAA